MEFFRNLRSAHHARHAPAEVAEFYSGLIYSTLDIELHHDLKNCMVADHELLQVWDKAINELANGKIDRWEEHFQMALEMSPQDFEMCGSNGKLRTVGRQIETWWELFWSQEDADEILEFNAN